MSSEDRLISKNKAAEILDCSIRTIERLICSGKLTKIKVRGAVKVSYLQVMTIVSQGC